MAFRTSCLIHSMDFICNCYYYFVFQIHIIQEENPNTSASYCQLTFCDLFFLFDQKLPKGRDCHHHHLCIPYRTSLKDGRHSVNSGLKCHYLKTWIQPRSLPENSSILLFVARINHQSWLECYFPTNTTIRADKKIITSNKIGFPSLKCVSKKEKW